MSRTRSASPRRASTIIFRRRAELGVAVVDRYAARCGAALAALDQDEAKSSMALLDLYAQPYLQVAKTPDRICLCGALAGEMPALPPEMRMCVERFFATNHAWLAGLLERGVR